MMMNYLMYHHETEVVIYFGVEQFVTETWLL
jgi:hypothetical protein